VNEEHKSWTLDDTSIASNPGNLDVNLVRCFCHYPKWPMIWFLSLVLFVALACLFHWTCWIVSLLLLAINWFYWQRVRDHFRKGCANPAVIVSLEPMLIAVSTDLTKGIGEYPVVKIIKKYLPTACGQVPLVGARLPAVALYQPSPDEDLPHWADFDPRPIDCATGDVDAMQAVMSTFTEDDWNELTLWLEQVPRPFRCGLYHVQASE